MYYDGQQVSETKLCNCKREVATVHNLPDGVGEVEDQHGMDLM